RFTVVPGSTVPKSRLLVLMLSAPGSVALPETLTSPVPAVVVIAKSLVKRPLCVGENVTETTTDAPGASADPIAGAPESENGAAGCVTPVIVSGDPPVFENVTVSVRWRPTTTPPRLSVRGDTVSCAPAAMPLPESPMLAVP